jgi:CD209 antigen/hemicentin
MVKVIGAQPILKERFSLTCGTAGTVYSIQWMRNGWPLYADNRTDFSMNSNTLTFNSLQDSDNGDYQCSASNPLSNMTSTEYRLIVNCEYLLTSSTLTPWLEVESFELPLCIL